MKKILLWIAVFALWQPAVWAQSAIGQVVSVNEADGSVRVVSADGRERVVKITGDTRMFGAASIGDLNAGDSVTVNGDDNFVTGELNAATVERVSAAVTPAEGPLASNGIAIGSTGPTGSIRVTSAPLVALENRRAMAESPIDNTVALDREVSPGLAREEARRSQAGIVSTASNSSPVDNPGAGDRFVSKNLAQQESANAAATTNTTTS